MKVRLENPIAGYEEIAEYRYPKRGEHYLTLECRAVAASDHCCVERIVLTPKHPWRATNRGDYFFISASCTVLNDCDDRAPSDNARWELGNYFPTEEQAALAAKRIAACFAEIRKELTA